MVFGQPFTASCCTKVRIPVRIISTDIATSTNPISRSNAVTARSPSQCWIFSASTSTTAQTIMVTVSAPTHSHICPGACDVSSITVASADGPASAGIASGTISGSPPRESPPIGPSGCGKIIRKAIRNNTIPPPNRNDKSVRLIARRKRSPTSMNNSRIPKAIATSRKITTRLRSFATPRNALMKIGILPSGSVIRMSSTVAERKLYCTLLGHSTCQCSAHLLDHDVRSVIHRQQRGFGVASCLVLELAFLEPAVTNHQPMRHADQLPIREHHARALAAIVQDHVDTRSLQRRVELVGLLANCVAAVVAHRAQHDFERRDRFRPDDALRVEVLFDRCAKDPRDANAVAAHLHGRRLAVFIEERRTHGRT